MPRETVAGLRAQLEAERAASAATLEAITARATRAEKQVDELTKALVKVSTPPAPVKHKPRQGTPDVEGQAVERMTQHVKQKGFEAMLERGTLDLMAKQPGLSREKAAKEARQMILNDVEAVAGG